MSLCSVDILVQRMCVGFYCTEFLGVPSNRPIAKIVSLFSWQFTKNKNRLRLYSGYEFLKRWDFSLGRFRVSFRSQSQWHCSDALFYSRALNGLQSVRTVGSVTWIIATSTSLTSRPIELEQKQDARSVYETTFYS